HARDHEHGRRDAVGVDAGAPGIVPAPAHRAHVHPESRPSEGHVRSRGQDQNEERGHGQAEEPAVGEPRDRGRRPADAAIRIAEDDALEHTHRAEGQDEGWIRRRLLSRPVTAPLPAPRPMARRSAGAIMASRPAATSQTSTTIRPVSWPTDRSIRPQRITKVWPTARTASAADWVATLARLPSERNSGIRPAAASA